MPLQRCSISAAQGLNTEVAGLLVEEFKSVLHTALFGLAILLCDDLFGGYVGPSKVYLSFRVQVAVSPLAEPAPPALVRLGKRDCDRVISGLAWRSKAGPRKVVLGVLFVLAERGLLFVSNLDHPRLEVVFLRLVETLFDLLVPAFLERLVLLETYVVCGANCLLKAALALVWVIEQGRQFESLDLLQLCELVAPLH